jgi:tetratricopeptide (TPR) repeat protein
LERANLAEKTLVTLRDLSAQQNPYWSKQVEVQRQEVAAWIANENGKEDAMTMMRAAAELEESMDKHAVTPGSVTPAREMLAEMLMQANRPGESLAEYEAVLSNAPNRFNAIYGAAMAADAAGKRDIAQAYYKKLTEIAVGDERPELITARKKVMELAAANSDSRR